MRVSITGSRNINREDAIQKIEKIFSIYILQFGKELEFITGGCIGIDALAAQIACGMNIKVHTVLTSKRETTEKYWQTWCTSYEEMPAKTTYRDRDKRMVQLGDELLAFPSCDEYMPDKSYTRSGTWMTVRIARKANKSVIITKVKE